MTDRSASARTARRNGAAVAGLVLAFLLAAAPGAHADMTVAQAQPAPADQPAPPSQPAPADQAQPSQPAQSTPPAQPTQPTQPSPPPSSQPTQPAPSAQPKQPAPPGTATVFGKDEIQGVLGNRVFSNNGENMGQIANVIVDRDGQPRAVVIDFGGFLGVGSRKIAVDWAALHFAPDGKAGQVTLDLTRDQLKSAPEYKEGQPVVVVGTSGNVPITPGGELK